MTYEELLINIELKGYENVLPTVGKRCLDCKHWFVVCDDGDCHLFDRYGKEDDIKKITKILRYMILRDVKKIVIPNSVTRINQSTFVNCHGLISVMIPDSVMSIGSWAFSYCNELMSMTIPDSVEFIGYHTFDSCWKLTNIIIDKPIEQVKAMKYYPFGIENESIIKCN